MVLLSSSSADVSAGGAIVGSSAYRHTFRITSRSAVVERA